MGAGGDQPDVTFFTLRQVLLAVGLSLKTVTIHGVAGAGGNLDTSLLIQ